MAVYPFCEAVGVLKAQAWSAGSLSQGLALAGAQKAWLNELNEGMNENDGV
jgi:hypothetical protein